MLLLKEKQVSSVSQHSSCHVGSMFQFEMYYIPNASSWEPVTCFSEGTR